MAVRSRPDLNPLAKRERQTFRNQPAGTTLQQQQTQAARVQVA